MRTLISSSTIQRHRLDPTAGIAIGPILFIIAVLGILAAAIAAGSGSFTSGTAGESNRTKATALIDMGQNLKIGFERIVGNGTDFGSVIIDPTLTSLSTHLFSPTGGGITSPSRTMAATPSVDDWMYPLIAFPGVGTASGQRFAMIRVTEGVCDEVNVKTIALAAGTAHTERKDIGDLTSTGLIDLTGSGAWPPSFEGKPTGCIENVNAAALSSGFFYYQVIGVQ